MEEKEVEVINKAGEKGYVKKQFHSYRNASIGFNFEARHAG